MHCPDCGTFFSKEQTFCLNCGQILSDGNKPAYIGAYRLIRRIGQGGMGMVYHAYDPQNNRDVAVKVLHRHLLGDLQQMNRFKREMRMHSKLKHPNIVSVLDIYESGHVIALIMELIQGCTLKEFIKHRKIPSWGEIVAISDAILQALAEAHKAQIIHRDLKLSNVFLADDGSIKLMDFGLAKTQTSEDDITESGATVGTYHYMAPEQVLGTELDGRTDLYAYGVMLYRMACGQLPFTAGEGGDFELLDKHVRQEPVAPEQINPEIPKKLSRLIMQLLEKKPENRPASCDVVIKKLHEISDPIPPSLDGMSFSELHRQLEQVKQSEPTQTGSSQINEQTPEQTMLWAFRENSPVAPEEPPLDLRSPPPIEREILLKLRESIRSIPPLPEIWHEVEHVLNNPESSPSDLAAVISKDPVLTAHILRIGNSAAYALPGKKITNVAIVIARLGMDTAHNLLMQKMIPDFSRMKKRDPEAVISIASEVGKIWLESQSIALIARFLSDFSQTVDGQSASMFGILHDIGKFVILHTEDDETLQRLRIAISSGSPTLKAEWDVLGYTHIDAGMMLALHWKLPRKIHRLIYYHHHPEWHSADIWPADVQPSIMLLHMAHLILQDMNAPTRGDEIPVDLDRQGVWQMGLRSHTPESEMLLRKPLRLPLKDVASYKRLMHEMEHLSASCRLLLEPIDTEKEQISG